MAAQNNNKKNCCQLLLHHYYFEQVKELLLRCDATHFHIMHMNEKSQIEFALCFHHLLLLLHEYISPFISIHGLKYKGDTFRSNTKSTTITTTTTTPSPSQSFPAEHLTKWKPRQKKNGGAAKETLLSPSMSSIQLFTLQSCFLSSSFLFSPIFICIWIGGCVSLQSTSRQSSHASWTKEKAWKRVLFHSMYSCMTCSNHFKRAK